MNVSVVIPVWNRNRDLEKCLESLQKLSYKDFEVIVVDNGSTDGTKEMVKGRFPNVILVENEKNMGVSYAKNQGIVKSRGNLVWFLDSDSEVLSKDTLKEMVELFKDEKIGAIGGEIRKENKKEVRGMNILKNGASEFVTVKKGSNEVLECDFLVTANCIVRKKILEKLGGFDTSYFYFGEDKELGYKIKKLNYKVVVTGKTGVLHKVSSITRVSNFYKLYRNNLRFVLKNFELKNILLLPAYDFLYFFRKKTMSRVKGKNLEDIACFRARYRSKTLKLIFIGVNLGMAIIYSYLWNLVFLPKTINSRSKERNFLKEVEI